MATTTPANEPTHEGTGILCFVRAHPVLTYFALTFAISWGAIIGAFGLGPISPAQLQDRGPVLYVALLLGPSAAGLVSLGLVAGRPGFRELQGRLLNWRVAPRWYAVALLAAPLSIIPVLLALSLVPGLLPDVFTSDELGARLLTGMSAGLAVAVCEELGWTGFVTPRLRAHHGIAATGLILGLVWGAWHFPPFWEHDSLSAALPLGVLLARLFSWLPPFRMLMVWVHDRSNSLLVVILMHMSLVATQLVLVAPFEFELGPSLIYILVWAAVLWVLAGAVMTRREQSISRPGSSRALDGSS